RDKFRYNTTFKQEIKEQLRTCRYNTNMTCNKTREEARKIALGFLDRVCTNYSEILERIKARINASEKLSQEEKANFITLIESKKAEFEVLCARLNETSNVTEIKNISRELKNLFREIKQIVRSAFMFHHERRVGLVIERMLHMEEKLERFLEKYRRKDREEIQDLLQQFKQKIREANSTYQESKALWQQVHEDIMRNKGISCVEVDCTQDLCSTAHITPVTGFYCLEPVEETIKQANAKMQEAQKKLKEAHGILMQIIRKLKQEKQLEGGEK
ncbi:MAG: hypothetical protein NZ889_02040, partial [Candidatus Pacearchaeota archaeon]|nr:hypothetical protein [Candidatus Pacearchaeota archaeon]